MLIRFILLACTFCLYPPGPLAQEWPEPSPIKHQSRQCPPGLPVGNLSFWRSGNTCHVFSPQPLPSHFYVCSLGTLVLVLQGHFVVSSSEQDSHLVSACLAQACAVLNERAILQSPPPVGHLSKDSQLLIGIVEPQLMTAGPLSL